METMQDFMDQIDQATRDIKRGDLVDGKVIQLGDDCIIADINYAQDGVIYQDELVKEATQYAVEDAIKLIVIGFSADGQVVLSESKAQRQYGKALLEEAAENGSYVEGTLKSIAKGGFRVDVLGIVGYLPFSLYQKQYLNDPESLVGTTTQLAIERSDARGYVFTRLPIERELYAKIKRDFYSTHGKGDTVKGKLSGFNRGGVVVDVDGMRGFIPRSEVSYSRQVKAEDILRENMVLNLIIRELSEKEEKLILSLKDALDDPWVEINNEIALGDVFDVMPIGQNQNLYFYELIDGVEGSLYKKQVPEDVIKSNEAHSVEVVGIDRERRRIELAYYYEVANYDESEQSEEDSDNTLGNLFGDQLKKIKF